jgi:hypothetical protein
MSIVVVPKFVLSSFLESIVRHRITHLWYVVVHFWLSRLFNICASIVPPQVVLLCKVISVNDQFGPPIEHSLESISQKL